MLRVIVERKVPYHLTILPSDGPIGLGYIFSIARCFFVDLGPNAPLRLRRWLRVKVSGQGPPKPSPAGEAQRLFGVRLGFV